jgi:hypothetical protein
MDTLQSRLFKVIFIFLAISVFYFTNRDSFKIVNKEAKAATESYYNFSTICINGITYSLMEHTQNDRFSHSIKLDANSKIIKCR